MEKPVSSPSIGRRELEDNLRSKLEDASTRYKSAHASYRKELEKESEGRGNASGALLGAREEESKALAEYRHALRTFTDLTIHGKQPGAQPAETFESLGNNSLIAVVDDDESVRESLNTFLRSVGYQVRTFPSADIFMDSESYRETECVLLDLRMPGIDGFELQSRLNAQHSKIPIIVITAHDDQPARRRAIAAGAMDVLHKPFAARLLLEAVEKALQKTAAWRVGQSA